MSKMYYPTSSSWQTIPGASVPLRSILTVFAVLNEDIINFVYAKIIKLLDFANLYCNLELF